MAPCIAEHTEALYRLDANTRRLVLQAFDEERQQLVGLLLTLCQREGGLHAQAKVFVLEGIDQDGNGTVGLIIHIHHQARGVDAHLVVLALQGLEQRGRGSSPMDCRRWKACCLTFGFMSVRASLIFAAPSFACGPSWLRPVIAVRADLSSSSVKAYASAITTDLVADPHGPQRLGRLRRRISTFLSPRPSTSTRHGIGADLRHGLGCRLAHFRPHILEPRFQCGHRGLADLGEHLGIGMRVVGFSFASMRLLSKGTASLASEPISPRDWAACSCPLILSPFNNSIRLGTAALPNFARASPAA